MDVCGAPPAGCGAGGETGSLGAHAGVTPAGTAPLLQPPARPSPPITQPAPAPDGGWGWVVCAGAFMCNVVMDGMLFSFGVFFIELLYCFGESKGRTALVGSMLMGTHLFLGPLVSAMVNVWGLRRVTMAGGLISSFAFAVSTLAPSISVLTLTYGILGGLGVSMVYIPSILVVGFYFDKHRALANGITSSGSGIGTFIYSPLCNHLLQEYSWRGTLLLLAAVALNCVAFGALYRPIDAPQRNRERESCELQEKTVLVNSTPHDSVDCKGIVQLADVKAKSHHCLPLIMPSEDGDAIAVRLPNHDCRTATKLMYDSRSNMSSDGHGYMLNARFWPVRACVSTPNLRSRPRARVHLAPLSRKDCFYSGSIQRLAAEGVSRPGDRLAGGPVEGRWEKLANTLHRILAVSLLKNGVFLVFTLSSIMWTTHSTILTFLPDYAIQLGCDDRQAALLIALVGIANTIGRIAIGWITDRPGVRAVWINAVALLVGAVVCVAIAYTRRYELLAVEAVVFGTCMATWTSLRPIVLVELLGIDKLTNAFGLLAMFQGIAFSIGPPLAGAYHDHSGSYSGVFCMAGAAFLLSGILLILLDRVCRVTQTDSISFSDDTGSSDTDDLSNRNYLSLKH